MKYYYLTNSKAGNSRTRDEIEKLVEKTGKAHEILDVTQLDFESFFSGLEKADKVVLCGGDGTLNQFVNRTKDLDIQNDILLFSAGSGNDFLFDLGIDTSKDGPVKINKYLKNLPVVRVNDVERLFVNNVGFGVDGYCCEVADMMKEKGKNNINYASIAIKGLLGKFRPASARITVDGKEYTFDHVWIAATMHGRAYGGGMLAAPAQDRMNKEGKQSLLVFRSCLRLHALALFPGIFKGRHVKHKKNCFILEGHDFEVEFDRPCACQIDGETIRNVKGYKVFSKHQ